MANLVHEPFNLGAWCEARHKKLRKAMNRLGVFYDMLINDHGLVRMLYANEFHVTHRVLRRSHPNPHDVARARRQGIKTIVNLRGENDVSSNRLSGAACRKHGVTLIEFRTRSARPPSKEMLHAARELFESIEYPVMLHCKSGADRSGLMSTLYLILCEGQSVAEARKQLHWRYGHFRRSRAGILDGFFDHYERDSGAKPMDFLTWVDEKYDPEALQAAFRGGRLTSRFVDRLLRRE
jgi:protein tyrosine/serine phosphatase